MQKPPWRLKSNSGKAGVSGLKRKRGKCKIYLPPSALSLSTPTAQASSVQGLADGLGIVLVRRDKAIMIVTVYFKRNFPAGNPEFKKKKRMSRKNGVSFNMYRHFTLDIKSEHLSEVCPEKNMSLKKLKGRVIAGKIVTWDIITDENVFLSL